MDIIEAVHQRKSIRAFKPDPVPQKILREILEITLRAPSWANIQPWELAVVGGSKLEEIKQAFVDMAEERFDPDLSISRAIPEPYNTRRRALGLEIFKIKGISREDSEKRNWWQLQGLRLFEAPNVIYIYIDRSLYFPSDGLNVWPLFDCGLIAQNIMLLATHYGLGTIIQIQAVGYPSLLRKVLGIPDSKLIVLGIAIGYPNWDDPINQFRSEREPLDNIAKWCGFD